MTPSEKQALLQFMGVTYGQALKTDRDIVGQSAHLRPVSEQLKQQFTQVMATPTTEQQYTQPVYVEPPAVVVPESPPTVSLVDDGYVDNMQYIQKSVLPVVTPSSLIVHTKEQSELINVLTDIKVALEKIATTLDKQLTTNVKAAKPKIKEQG